MGRQSPICRAVQRRISNAFPRSHRSRSGRRSSFLITWGCFFGECDGRNAICVKRKRDPVAKRRPARVGAYLTGSGGTRLPTHNSRPSSCSCPRLASEIVLFLLRQSGAGASEGFAEAAGWEDGCLAPLSLTRPAAGVGLLLWAPLSRLTLSDLSSVSTPTKPRCNRSISENIIYP